MKCKHKQEGYFLILAVIFILVLGVMGSLIAYLFAERAQISVAQQYGLRAFYMAESGYEIGTRLLSMPSISGTPTRIACGSLTGNAAVTNAALLSGTITLSTINSSPIFAVDTLNAAMTTSSTSISLSDVTGFASSGRVMIDREAIDYAAISGNTLIGLTRAAGGTTVSSHASGASVGQYQCSVDVLAGIPSVASPTYQRELQWNVGLQDGWTVGNVGGSNFTFSRWNRPTELAFNSANVAGGSSATGLKSISMLSYVDGWAVGNVDSNNFIYLHWDGSSWQLTAEAGACGTQDLSGVSVVSSQEAWAVGGRYRPLCVNVGLRRYTVRYWNGSAWTSLTPLSTPHVPPDDLGNEDLNAVHVIDTDGDGLGNIGFAVGDSGTILKYNGSNWDPDTNSDNKNLNGVFTVSSSEAWAVGASGTILKWNGSTWNTVSSPVNNALNGIAMFDADGNGSADSGFAVGNNGKILSYDGSSWSSADMGNSNLFGVAMINASDAWVVGVNGVAYHWDGSTWTSADSGTTHTLNAVSLIATREKPASSWRQVFH